MSTILALLAVAHQYLLMHGEDQIINLINEFFLVERLLELNKESQSTWKNFNAPPTREGM